MDIIFREFNHNLTQQLLLMLGKTGIWGMIVRKFVNQGMNDRLLRVVQPIYRDHLRLIYPNEKIQ